MAMHVLEDIKHISRDFENIHKSASRFASIANEELERHNSESVVEDSLPEKRVHKPKILSAEILRAEMVDFANKWQTLSKTLCEEYAVLSSEAEVDNDEDIEKLGSDYIKCSKSINKGLCKNCLYCCYRLQLKYNLFCSAYANLFADAYKKEYSDNQEENNQNHTNLPSSITVEIIPAIKQESVIISTEAARNMLHENIQIEDKYEPPPELTAGVHFLTDDETSGPNMDADSYEKKKNELLEYMMRQDGSVVSLVER
ncbi:unnamed protein product [Phaedon cochleariae]|uniref:Uncharacterized protein n=1 Tax=Phaedon cochleariae TaxID=80249 RepID=A0A9N9S8X8_PHACE|nr:unnamed protein product [Phaedon cochleariae]